MLALTETAAEAVRQLAANSGLGPEPGVRIAPGMPTDSGIPLEISLAGGPETDDQTVQNDGATVYVEDHVTELLDDKVLDASIDEGQVRFAIHDA